LVESLRTSRAGLTNMKLKLLVAFVLTLGCLVAAVAYSSASFDGTNPPHAVDTDGKTIPESSATQPDKPIILSKDIGNNTDPDNKYGELKPEAAFDHAKHNTDLKHTLDGATLTACVECHHTEQPSAPAGRPYLKTFNPKRTEILTTAQLETSKEPVKDCRTCHFQKSTAATDEYPPKSVMYPREIAKQMGTRESGDLDNQTAYHARCIKCHERAMKRDATLKAPFQRCDDCHLPKGTSPTPSASPATATPSPAS